MDDRKFIVKYMCAKNYRNKWSFDKAISKIKHGTIATMNVFHYDFCFLLAYVLSPRFWKVDGEDLSSKSYMVAPILTAY